MLRRVLAALAAVCAMGLLLGSTSGASASYRHRHYSASSDCCGPVSPIYLSRTTTRHVTEYRHRNVYRTVHFARYRPVYHTNHVHVVRNIHTLTHVHVSRIGHIVDVPHYNTVYSYSTYNTGSVYTTVTCGCGRHASY